MTLPCKAATVNMPKRSRNQGSTAELLGRFLGKVPVHQAKPQCTSQTQQTEVQNGGEASRQPHSQNRK